MTSEESGYLSDEEILRLWREGKLTFDCEVCADTGAPGMTFEELQAKYPPADQEEYDRAYAAAVLAGETAEKAMSESGTSDSPGATGRYMVSIEPGEDAYGSQGTCIWIPRLPYDKVWPGCGDTVPALMALIAVLSGENPEYVLPSFHVIMDKLPGEIREQIEEGRAHPEEETDSPPPRSTPRADGGEPGDLTGAEIREALAAVERGETVEREDYTRYADEDYQRRRAIADELTRLGEELDEDGDGQ